MPFPSLSQPGWVLAGAPKLKAKDDLILFNNKIMIKVNLFIVWLYHFIFLVPRMFRESED